MILKRKNSRRKKKKIVNNQKKREVLNQITFTKQQKQKICQIFCDGKKTFYGGISQWLYSIIT